MSCHQSVESLRGASKGVADAMSLRSGWHLSLQHLSLHLSLQSALLLRRRDSPREAAQAVGEGEQQRLTDALAVEKPGAKSRPRDA